MRAAEQIARHNRGAKIHIAKLVASVSEPLPDLQWSDKRASSEPNYLSGAGKMADTCNSVGASPMTPMSEKQYRGF